MGFIEIRQKLIHDVVSQKTHPRELTAPENRPSSPKRGKDPQPNHHLFSDYVSFGECNKCFQGWFHSVSRFAFLLFHRNFPLLLGQRHSKIFTSGALGKLCVLEILTRLMMFLLYNVILFYFLLIVFLLGWGNSLNKPGQLHNHLETEENLFF